MTFDFELSTPFKPFEQLMGVLPTASMEHIPEAYRDLMYDPNSPILDFYPTEFEQDLNGKKQDWEAIVKIPFIDEARLLKAMACEYLSRLVQPSFNLTFVSS
jgi:5'-3' exoribonuclease 1